MSARTIEARLVISGEDRASAAIASVVKTVRQLEDAAKVSKPLQEVAKSLMQVEQAEKAVNAAMSARSGFATAEAGLKATRGAATAAAQALNEARAARTAFEGVKAVKGSDQAKQIEAATRAVRDAGAAYRKAESDVRRATAAIAAQSATLQHAESAATKLGADLGNLEAHQQRLRASTEAATGAMRAQIRVEDAAARAAAHHAREEAEYRRHASRHGAVGYAASAAAGYVGVHSVTHEIGSSIKAGARYQHEVVALRNAGRTPEEMREISHASDAAVRAVPTATFEENLKVINETTGAFGTLHHAIENLTFMQKSAAAVHASAGDKIQDGAGELGNKLARFFEMRGTAGNTDVFQREAGEMIRAMIFTRGNFNPGEMVNFAQQAKASLPLYNERFLTKIAPSLVTEYGGDRAGTAANAFRGVIMGKANDKKQAEEWVRLGLLDPSQAIMKGGHAVSWKAGAVKDTNTALSDPLQWAETVLIPALQKKGVNVDDKLELSKALGTLFRNSNSNLFAEALTQKLSRNRLHKDEENINKAGTLEEVYKRNLAEDPTEGLKAVKAGLENLLSTASSPLMGTAATALTALAGGLQSFALAAKDHPGLAVAGGVGAGAAGLAGAGYASYKLMTGFGLPAAAGELTIAAKMLQAAAVEKGVGDLPGGKGKGAFLGALGAFGLPALGAAGVAYVLSEYGDASKSVNGTGGRPDIQMNPGDELPGVGGSTDKPSWVVPNAPSMTLAPGAMPLTIQGSGIGGFGLSGPVAPGQAGKEAGEKVGQGVADGIQAKAPEVEQQGRTLYEKIKELFGQGINLPINFAPGEGMGGGGAGGGLIHKASFGGGGSGGSGGLDGLIRRSNLGGGSDDGSHGTGFVPRSGSGGISARDMRGINPEFAAHIRASALSQGIDPDIALRIANSEGLRGSNPNRLTPGDYENRKPTSFGPYQLHYGRSGGLGNRYTKETGHHAGDPTHWREQIDFALRIARKEGWGAWYGRRGAGIGVRDGIGTVRPVPMPKGGPLVPADEPRLVKGLDGKEGLDLGNGTMKMPDGSIRSIPNKAGLTIPEPPAGGFGAGGGRGDMRAAAERMHQAADRMEGMGFHGQIQLAVTGSGRDSVRATGMRTRGRGGMSADMGISMPGAKESDGDWV